uniref:Phosphodiesterase n=1 Tax=Saccoglossus kowalevskii TaxID=10224 RepID=A0ABM0MKH3_SACKO|nr:PREDICTED: cGMP-dependent 3',5'-cyclic phosphodiesterase-like [Saccoglossus kowalevskii]
MATTTPSRDRRKFVKRLSSDGRKSVDDKTAEMSDRRRQETFEDALLELCAVLDWESLNEVIQNVLKDCLPNVTDSVVYILDNLSSNLQCKDQVTNTVHDLPKAGLARSVADGKKRISCNGLTQQDSLSGLLPSGVQPLSSNKTVLCTPIVDSQTDNVVCVLGVVCDVITLVDEKKLNLLEKHILVCIQRLLRTTYQYSRSSSVLSWSQSQSILKLCEDLYDRDAASLQLKVINYLEEQTDSEFCVILLRAEEEYEMCCQVLRNEVLEHEIVILTHGNLSDVIASKKAATLNELGDSAVELSQKLGMTINSMLCVPLTKRKSTEIAAIVCAFNKKGGQSYTEEDEARIRFCFKYTSSIIASALAFQKENKLKKETEALLQMAKNLFTHLGKYCLTCISVIRPSPFEIPETAVKAVKSLSNEDRYNDDIASETDKQNNSALQWLISKFKRSTRKIVPRVLIPSTTSVENSDSDSSIAEEFSDASDRLLDIKISTESIESGSIQRTEEKVLGSTVSSITVENVENKQWHKYDSKFPLERKQSEEVFVVKCDSEAGQTVLHSKNSSLQLDWTPSTLSVRYVPEPPPADNFPDISNDVCVLLKEVMQEARNMTHAERCSLFLVENNELVAKVFDGNVTENGEVLGEVRIPINQGIAGHVATSGRILNIKDAYSHPLFYRGVDETTGFRTRNILCFPINDESGKVIGIAELCNKINAPYFGKHDEEVALAFSVYCGISIVHSLMYKKVKDAQYRSKLSNELMMYHMQISCDELQQLIAADIPKPETFLADIAQYSSIPRAVPESETPLIEILGLFVASLCHDLDHRGTNNSFQVQSESVLASLYSSEGSVLERHHFSQALCILNTEGCNIFENITSKDYQEVLDLMQEIILATDLAHHLRIIKDLKKMAVEGYKKEDPHCHKLLRCLFMTACDLSDQTKNWQTIKKVAENIYQEFFRQGDLEKAMGNNPIEMMDREKACIPELQINFLDTIAHPVFQILGQLFPEAMPLNDAVENNKTMWKEVKAETQRRKLSSTNSLDFFRLKLESVERGIMKMKNGEQFDDQEENDDVNNGK